MGHHQKTKISKILSPYGRRPSNCEINIIFNDVGNAYNPTNRRKTPYAHLLNESIHNSPTANKQSRQ